MLRDERSGFQLYRLKTAPVVLNNPKKRNDVNRTLSSRERG